MNGLITVSRTAEGRVQLCVPYSAENLAAVRALPGRLWDGKRKVWTIPDEPGLRLRLEQAFAGRRLSWLEEQSPDQPRPPSIDEGPLGRMRDAMRSRHLSPRTEKSYLAWARRFLARETSPSDQLGEKEVGRFLTCSGSA